MCAGHGGSAGGTLLSIRRSSQTETGYSRGQRGREECVRPASDGVRVTGASEARVCGCSASSPTERRATGEAGEGEPPRVCG